MKGKYGIIMHLKARGSITPLEALDLYGVYRLSSVIHRLRNQGFDIETKKTFKNGKEFATYIFRNEYK